jgi:hypothetical protein
MNLSLGEEQRYVIKLFLTEGQEPNEIYPRLRRDYQDDPPKKLAFCC